MSNNASRKGYEYPRMRCPRCGRETAASYCGGSTWRLRRHGDCGLVFADERLAATQAEKASET